MKTYTVIKGLSEILNNNASITDAHKLIPAGSQIVSGNKTERKIDGNKVEDVILEYRAGFKAPNGDRYSIIENESKTS